MSNFVSGFTEDVVSNSETFNEKPFFHVITVLVKMIFVENVQ